MLTIAGRTFRSRLFGGTGKFSSSQVMKEALDASGCEMVTVALRRVDLANPEDDIMSVLDRKKFLFLPNTSGARDADEAVRLARLARAAVAARLICADDLRTARISPHPRRPSPRFPEGGP